MSRTLPFGFDVTERASKLAPAVELAWSARYLGRPVLVSGGAADDGLVTNYAALAVRGTELLLLKSNGTAVEFQRRTATTLAVTAAWASIFVAGVAAAPVGLTQAGTAVFAFFLGAADRVSVASSADGGVTWSLAATLRTAAAGNTLWSILTSVNGLVAIEERQAAGTALLYTYSWNGAAWVLVDTHDTGGTAVAGGGIEIEGGTLIVYAVDVLQATTAGTVTLRYTRVYDLDTLTLRGSLHQGSANGVRWRDPRPVYLTASGARYLLTTVQIPRGAGDASDRVALLAYAGTQLGAHHPVGPARVVYAVEDTESAAVAYGAGALFVMAGSFIQRLTESAATGTVATAEVEIAYEPEGESLGVLGPGSLDASALQLRARLGLGSTFVDMGLFWIGNRIGASREGWKLAGYGLWGVLRRELQQQSCELREAGGAALTPGACLQLIFTGLGFSYSEDAGLAASLHPATTAERLTWTMRYGQSYAELARSLLRWSGCEIVPGVAVDGVTPTVRVMRPGSRFGPTPTANPALGAAGDHPLLELVSVDPETVTDATVFPGGWDNQITLSEPVDRQLVVDASGAYGVTSTIEPATRALARALAGAEAGSVRIRPALEIELWDTISITDGLAGLSAARRLARSVSVVAGKGRWEMSLELGLE